MCEALVQGFTCIFSSSPPPNSQACVIIGAIIGAAAV